MSYEMMTNEYMRRFDRPTVDLMAAIVAGGMAGIFYWIGGMPPDVLKSRLQTGKLWKSPNVPINLIVSPDPSIYQLLMVDLTVFETFLWTL